MTAPESPTPLRIERLVKRFQSDGRRVEALAEVSSTLAPGVVTGLVGPDGAGKTTLMRVVAGLLRPDAGRVEVLGLDVARDPLAVQSCIGYMPQRFGLYEDLSVRENLDLYADLHQVPEAARTERYARLMDMTGLAPFMSRLAGRLSGGMKQKLGLACTLVEPPRLLLLDEPTVGVDPVSRRELWSIVDQLVQQDAMSVLLSTAYLDEAERCTDVILLHAGRLIDQGPPARFSEPLRGRVFQVSATPATRRARRAELSRQPGVVDAVLQGESIRVILDATSARERQPDLSDWQAVAPRFEDGFVDRLSSGARAAPLSVSSSRTKTRATGTAIEVESLSRVFGDFVAVKGASFSVAAGEVFGLLGANGAGKTTTFRMLCGLLPPSAGQVRVAGVDLRRAPAEARGRVGYMSQSFALYTNLTVRQNLEFFARAYGLRGPQVRARIDWAFASFELEALSTTDSGALPLGYKQRLAMAAALMHEPDILFLDEPTSGVDPLARREFWDRINALAEDGVTILVTTHFLQEAEYCDRLAILAAGEILALGTPAEIKTRAATPEHPCPELEDAFIRLIQTHEPGGGS
ncbi:ATP-binding cassette domain-containing protein [Allochromatium palmeri]|uniref:ATP-binding cassette domain-containing protein n=1 Tax=Allochromatium palmeri TaxID=231048 RepID=A0A6N8EAK9_9GAMM|nr:ATP-binding cassette domain-containing protein [Allochromatium palmeri]MTW19666.1 ATP-binding cassette domain-containing protein [Allochromatium palmeri]